MSFSQFASRLTSRVQSAVKSATNSLARKQQVGADHAGNKYFIQIGSSATRECREWSSNERRSNERAIKRAGDPSIIALPN